MAKKKVVDAEILLDTVRKMQMRSYAFSQFNSVPNYGSSGNPQIDLQNALNNVTHQIGLQITQQVNNAMMTMLHELTSAIMLASREEDGGLCGLCRIDENSVMPVDYRPAANQVHGPSST